MISMTDMALRLGAAALIGGVVGLNRDLHHKPTGVRTLGLVGIASATLMILASEHVPDATANALTAVMTGIGFIGAGVILRGESESRIQGLTTAAVVWLVAALGLAAGLGAYWLAIMATALSFVVLETGKAIERFNRSVVGPAPREPDSLDGGEGAASRPADHKHKGEGKAVASGPASAV